MIKENLEKIQNDIRKYGTDKVRLIIGEQLLRETSISVLDISERCGFPCLSTFNRSFLKRNGIPPREYRKNIKIEQKTKI